MIVSYNWLQTYFKKSLPSPESVGETLIFHAFEVESVEPKGGDHIFDIKVLPDRAHDCLSHRGIARELAAHLHIPIVEKKSEVIVSEKKLSHAFSINVNEQTLCRRYMGRVIEGVTITPSPDSIKESLLAIGQKSINNIVDATNYVMFDLGQPLHAFDADKVVGNIVVRKAKEGECITTLDGKDVTLDTETLIIADDEGPLAIAGIKGGKKAEITEKTTSIILEAANFAPVNIRKTFRRLGIQTDSSKRFENERSPEGVLEAMDAVTLLIVEIAGTKSTIVSDVIDIYPRKPNPYIVGISTEDVNGVLGTALSFDDISALLTRASFEHRVVKNPLGEVCGGASALIDVPYKIGASITYDAPRAFDCSSFTAYLFSQAGVQIPRMAVDQFVFGEEVHEKDILPGDLVFSNTENGKIHYESIEWLKGTKVPSGVDHCGIYLGHGNVIHATRATGKVVMEKLTDSTQFKNIVGWRRIDVSAPRLRVVVPHDRLDIRAKEELIEEIGRVYGYENIKPRKLSLEKKDVPVNKEFYYVNKIKNILVNEGYSEIYTSSFTQEGDIIVLNPVAADKGALRTNLSVGMEKSLELNNRNLPLLDSDTVKIFEIGNVFTKTGGEYTALAIGVAEKGPRSTIEPLLTRLSSGGAPFDIHWSEKGNSTIAEINLTVATKKLPELRSYDNELATMSHKVMYRAISPYPFVLRDIAVFVPPKTEEWDVLKVITYNSGELLIRNPKLFDRFEKKNKESSETEKISYAFRLVFQSSEKTLSDDEVNVIMDKVTAALNANAHWQVR